MRLLLLLVSTALYLSAESYGVINKWALYVRENPDMAAKPIGALEPTTIFTFNSTELDSWAYVKKKGYVKRNCIDLFSKDEIKKYRTTSATKYYNKPHASEAFEVASIAKNTAIEAYCKSNGWCVSRNSGLVLNSALTLLSPETRSTNKSTRVVLSQSTNNTTSTVTSKSNFNDAVSLAKDSAELLPDDAPIEVTAGMMRYIYKALKVAGERNRELTKRVNTLENKY
jgi:hypothetical protein